MTVSWLEKFDFKFRSAEVTLTKLYRGNSGTISTELRNAVQIKQCYILPLIS